ILPSRTSSDGSKLPACGEGPYARARSLSKTVSATNGLAPSHAFRVPSRRCHLQVGHPDDEEALGMSRIGSQTRARVRLAAVVTIVVGGLGGCAERLNPAQTGAWGALRHLR